ncbi:MAG: hypothetical protein Q9166_000211 [cf. Caloplaca sp. 2 TL-2023]
MGDVPAAYDALRPTQPLIKSLEMGEHLKRAYPLIFDEISLLVRASLQSPAASHTNNLFSAKPHLILHCPREGSTDILESLIKTWAASHKADLIKIDAQDIAEIGGDYLDDPGIPPNETLSSLSYDIHASSNDELRSAQDSTGSEKFEGEEEEEDNPHRPTSIVKTIILRNLPDVFKGKLTPSLEQQQSGQPAKPTVVKDATKELKLAMFVDSLLDACDTKRAIKGGKHEISKTSTSNDRSPNDQDSSSGPAMTEPDYSSVASPAVIVLLNDYPEICNTDNGGRVMDALHDALSERRHEGKKILLIGTCEAKDHHPAFSRPGDSGRLWEFDAGPTRTIIVPTTEKMEKLCINHHKERTKAINLRHLAGIIRRRTANPERVSGVLSNVVFKSRKAQDQVEEYVWSADQVYRIANIALGIMLFYTKEGNIEAKHVESAVNLARRTDKVRCEWISKNKKKEPRWQKGDDGRLNRKQTASDSVRAKFRNQCNKHEERLLHGVVNPSSIRTTFADVRVPKETVETLKTLTSLSLLRPEQFTYGVLATDKITGVLLYGPPGTGKTMLAKAVAKESRATVLEVSGADLYNMWVGEGEKNVQAIFSLAKKLTPCIVFIDEADAILGSRGGSSNRVSHRELINQFLREWDGMDEHSAFIMVATNRPFDLDEATLRRLPRRLLVDLPTEKDREEILKIHLKDEILAPGVSLAKLAAETPLYSGSDLKNLCVAAALACVREEYDASNSTLQNTAVVTDAETSRPKSSTSFSTDSQPNLLASLSKPLADVSSSSNALFESLASLSESITLLLDSSTSEANILAASIDSETSTLRSQPPDTSLESLASPSDPSPPNINAANSTPSSSSSPAPSISDKSTLTKFDSPTPPAKASFPKRCLFPYHFARALEEISASVSDDMRSLTQIKKFDGKYGDRRSKKKKLGGGYGFGTSDEKEREKLGESGARVRIGTSD